MAVSNLSEVENDRKHVWDFVLLDLARALAGPNGDPGRALAYIVGFADRP